MMLYGSTVSYAEGRTGDIDLDYEGRTDYDDDVILEGAKFIIYPVKYVENGELVWRDEFAKCGISMDDSSSEAREEQAKNLYAYAKKHDIPGVIYITDKKGCIEINDLAEGIYLLAQTEKVEEGVDEFMSDPFLVMIPTEVDGKMEWDVDIDPKASWVSHNGEPVYPGNKDNPKGNTTDNPKDNTKEQEKQNNKVSDYPESTSKESKIQRKIFGFGKTKTGDLSPIDICVTICMVSAGMITIVWVIKKKN